MSISNFLRYTITTAHNVATQLKKEKKRYDYLKHTEKTIRYLTFTPLGLCKNRSYFNPFNLPPTEEVAAGFPKAGKVVVVVEVTAVVF